MSARKFQYEALGLSQSQVVPRVLNVLPMIAFPLTIMISVLTVPAAILWMIDVFVRGGDGAHLNEQLPRVAQVTDVRGLGQFERLSSSKWASTSHILPGRYLDPRKTLEGNNFKLIFDLKNLYSYHLAFYLALSIHYITQMEIPACPSLGRNIFARGRSHHPARDHPHVYYGSMLVSQNY